MISKYYPTYYSITKRGKSTNIMVSGKHNFKQIIKPKIKNEIDIVSFDNTATKCTKHLRLFLPKNASPESSHKEMINLEYRPFSQTCLNSSKIPVSKKKKKKNTSVIEKQEV